MGSPVSTRAARARRPSTSQPIPTVIAIPALDEELRLEACVEALLKQRDARGNRLPGEAIQIAILANNCSDGTAALARDLALRAASARDAPVIHVRDVAFPTAQAHAGQARRAALDWADELAAGEPDCLLLTTDADSRVHPDWIAKTWAAFAQGADAVAGTVEFDAVEAATLVLPEARRLEARYSALQAELMAALDPEVHNPWPNHVWAWGASLAVTRQAYRAVGGLPLVPLAEDRAFVTLLREFYFKVRHSLDVRVSTSCRTLGRAPGGLADLIAAYRTGNDCPCDAELQPVAVVAERARCRAYLRSIFDGRIGTQEAAERLGVSMETLELILAQRRFGQAWTLVEGASTRYYYTKLWPADLPLEIERAESLLTRLKGVGTIGRYGTTRAARLRQRPVPRVRWLCLCSGACRKWNLAWDG